MNRDIKKLAREFNRVAPPPPAPRDNTVYQDNKLDSAGAPADATPHPSLLPAWADTLPPDHQWLGEFFKSDAFRAIDANTKAMAQLPDAPKPEIIRRLRDAQIDVLRQNRRTRDHFGYRIFDPFRPLEDLESAATKTWIDAENDRTGIFTSTSARDRAATSLAAAWQGRDPQPFSTSADRALCMRGRYTDKWKYPVDKELNKKFFHTNEVPFAEVNGRIFARQYHKKARSTIVSFPADDIDAVTHVLHEPPDGQMRGIFIHGERIYISVYRQCADDLLVYDLNGRHLADAPLPPCKLDETSIDERTGKLRLRLSTFTRPIGDYLYDPETNTLEAEDPSPAPLGDCIVEQIWARSRDGANVPMWIVRHPDTALDGTAAVKTFAYGAAGISVEPHYSESIRHWIRAGGIYVLASLRGGGEFGDEWADDGMKMKRQNVIDDLNACARELWRRHYSCPERTVIEGGSNGGWLVLETVVQNAARFGAAVSHVPVADLFRIGTGSGTYPSRWEAKEFPECLRLSPYHNVKEGTVYTPTMITTGDQDTVANTWHALKMAAALQAASLENLCLLRVRHGTGHKPELFPTPELVAEEADIHAFIERCIGPVDQNDYKLWLETSIENEMDDHGAEITEEQHRRPSQVGLKSILLPRHPH